jgi:tRNA-splicing ligase RtcB
MMADIYLRQISDCIWEIPQRSGMRVPGRIYATPELMADIRKDAAVEQVVNVAHLPGIVGYSLAMPDIHWGYGFPIGGVAAVDAEHGVITPGGIGFDINCGVRLVSTNLQAGEIQPKLSFLADALFAMIPCGVGAEGAIPKLSRAEEKKLATDGVRWAIAHGFGSEADAEHTEENGCLAGADPAALSDDALGRGLTQVGTLGSGNHFLEVDRVEEIYEPDVATALGLSLGQVAVIIHSGSRGLGHQTCEDALKVMGKAMEKYHISVPDRQLACAPISSPEGQHYLAAMACAANYAWVNRQVMMSLAEKALLKVLQISPRDLGLRLIYDVCHNIAKPETHEVDGVKRKVWVHRKGATRAFGPGHPAIPASLRSLGQPVLIPGDMGRYSFLLVGTDRAMKETFGSTCHGAGRVMSRMQAKKAGKGRDLEEELGKQGVIARYRGKGTFAEEMPYAYKDVADVVEVVDRAGLSKKVVKLKPMAVIKG